MSQKKILIDSNVIFNLIFPVDEKDRETVEKLWDLFMLQKRDYQGYITDADIQKIIFYLRQYTNSTTNHKINQIIQSVSNLFTVIPITDKIIQSSFQQKISDFEFAVKIACAVAYQISCLVSYTDCYQYYKYTLQNELLPIDILKPKEFLEQNCLYFNRDKLRKEFQINESYIKSFEVYCGNDSAHRRATVLFENIDRKIWSKVSWGNGPVHAVYNAIREGLKGHIEIPDHIIQKISAESNEEGDGASITVELKVKYDNEILETSAIDTDVVTAAVKAYILMLKRIIP